jgi:hypothetical protein
MRGRVRVGAIISSELRTFEHHVAPIASERARSMIGAFQLSEPTLEKRSDYAKKRSCTERGRCCWQNKRGAGKDR